jgi:predicted DNA-binding transcriptional regulator YafY
MAKRGDTLESLTLALALLEHIPAVRKVTISELHEKLRAHGIERNKRTIERYMVKLSEHFPIECDDRSKPHGYRWMPHAHGLTIPKLDEQKSLLLTLAEQYLQNLLPASLMKSMEAFFDQARMNLDVDSKPGVTRAREWLDKVRVVDATQPLLPPKIDAEVFEQVSNALYANKWLEVDYQNAEGRRTQREVMPLGLAQQGPRLYLVVRFKGYDNERSLAVHRIKNARAMDLTFQRPKEFDLRQYDDDGRFGFGEGKKIRLRFRIDKAAGLHLLESPLSEDQVVVDCGEQYEISATVVETEQLEWWLRGFGEHVSAVHRIELQEACAADPPPRAVIPATL